MFPPVGTFLKAGKHILVNNTSVCKGGPFTRVDPANKSRKSVLTLVIVSKALFPVIESLEIDEENKWAPVKATKLEESPRTTSQLFSQ